MTKSRKSSKKLSANYKQHASQANLDIWLVRGSHIAQVGLFALTLWALFYTVIPLYKTAALEEQISRREAELKGTEKTLAETVAALNSATEQMYRRSRADVLWNLNYKAGSHCSGLFRPFKESFLSDIIRSEQVLLDINVRECIANELDKLKPESVLRREDLLILHSAIDETATFLEKRRSDANAAMRQIETNSTEELYAFAPKGPAAEHLDKWRDKVLQKHPELLRLDAEREHVNAVRRAQEKIARDFEEQVRVEIGKLRDIDWSVVAPDQV